jgi:hypothetical protein
MENMASFYQLAPPLKVLNLEKEGRTPIYFYIPAAKLRDPHVRPEPVPSP